MEAIILSGGFGTRLRSVVNNVPKPMAPILGKPFLSYILDDLSEKGFKRVVLATGYKSDIIQEYFKSSYRSLIIEYSQESIPLLTGGAVKQAMSKCESEEFFVLNGDTFFDVDYKKMLEKKRSTNADILIAGKKLYNFSRYGTLVYDDTLNVKAFHEKTFMEEGVINSGVYLFSQGIFNTMDSTKFSLEKDFFEVSTGDRNIFVYIDDIDKYFIDIGIPNDYEKAKEYFIRKKQGMGYDC